VRLTDDNTAAQPGLNLLDCHDTDVMTDYKSPNDNTDFLSLNGMVLDPYHSPL
jgi:hypothetical protein